MWRHASDILSVEPSSQCPSGQDEHADADGTTGQRDEQHLPHPWRVGQLTAEQAAKRRERHEAPENQKAAGGVGKDGEARDNENPAESVPESVQQPASSRVSRSEFLGFPAGEAVECLRGRPVLWRATLLAEIRPIGYRRPTLATLVHRPPLRGVTS